MATIIVLFNLKQGASREAYEAWVRRTDIPSVRSLGSVTAYEVFKCVSVRGPDRPIPYQYVELISIADPDAFGREVATEQMRAVAAELREFADAPLFINCDTLEP